MSKTKQAAVFGMGKSGQAALALAKKLGYEVFAVNQGSVESWYGKENLTDLISLDHCLEQEAATELFGRVDEIIISPGIPTTHKVLGLARQRGTPIISEIEFAYRASRDVPVIAITGTNGKTTTTTMIAEALERAGKKVFCGGNIGTPYCDLALSGKSYDYAVIEVSSFQLETIQEFHPHVALLLNLFPNHSERYDRFEDYGLAKFRITLNMTEDDRLILGTENPYLDLIHTTASKTFFTKGQLPEDFKRVFSFNQAKVRGEHNEANFFAAFKVLELLGIPNLVPLFQDFINEFKGVAHRLEYVLSSHGITLYNDAKSTNGLATTTAIRAFKDSKDPLYLILGGKLRNESDRLLPDLLPYRGQVTKVFVIGEVTDRLYQELGQEFEVVRAYDLKKVFEHVKKLGLKGNLVFSPAFPSFDQFKNYVDRGEKFKEWAREAF